ncbi:hypothetical protein GS937_16425 [Rhodococcus hoagii]|nr:hypothetical protein [Prescottella equi]
MKAAIIGSQHAMEKLGAPPAESQHVTVETTARCCSEARSAAVTALEPLGIDMIGLNCATGPDEMSEHLRHLSRHSKLPVVRDAERRSPQLGPNGAEYPLSAENSRSRCRAS